MQKDLQFHTEYWPKTGSTVTFVPADKAVVDLPVTAVKIFAIQDKKLLMTKISKGWDIPGGHVEAGETPEQALIREVKEETGSDATDLRLIGYLRITNDKESSNYPKVSCILLYKGQVTQLGSKSLLANFEADDREFISFDQLPNLYHSWSPMQQQIIDYARNCE